MTTKTFKGRPVLPGNFEGEAEVSDIGVNICATYCDVMFEGAGKDTGGFCVDHDNEALYKHDLRGKIICLPQTIGSSSSACAVLKILDVDVAPKAMLFANHIDSLAACGLLMADVWLEKRIFTVDNLGPEFLEAVKCGDKITVKEDGTVTITAKSGVGAAATVKRVKAEDHEYARDSLKGNIGMDANYTLSSQTGVQPTKTKDPAFKCSMTLTPEEQAIANGEKGEVRAKVIKTVIKFGELFGATKLVDLDCAPHLAMSWGNDVVEPFLRIYGQIADAGLKTYAPFTADPIPVDFENMPLSDEETKAMKALYHRCDELEAVNLRLGMKKDAWSCSSYLPQMGNRPNYGDNLAWSESSAINFANSCLGARTNRNSIGVDMLCALLGKAPYFGLMTDEGRKAHWLVNVDISKEELDHLPHPEMVGAAVGMKCVEEVPYITGMDKFVTKGICEETEGYMKDFGAATASSGALGLYHMEGVTPEAIKHGRSLLAEGYKTYTIDVAELTRIYNSYPDLWKGKASKVPQRIFIGCPHLSYGQYVEWGNRIVKTMTDAKKDKVAVEVSLFGGSAVKQDFKRRNEALYAKLVDYGVMFPECCPLMWCQSPVASDEVVATQSNKTRVYTTARFFFDAALCYLMVHGTLPDNLISLVADPGKSCGSAAAKSGDMEDMG